MKNWWLLMLAVLLSSTTMIVPANAAYENIAGRVIVRNGLELTVEQRDGRTRQVKLPEKVTVVAVPHVTAPLVDRIRVNSLVSIILKDGKPVILQVVEVPK